MKKSHRKAFTYTEMIIVVMILGVLAMLVMPVLKNVVPSKNKVLYRKAVYSFSEMVAEVTSDNNMFKQNVSNVFSQDMMTDLQQSRNFCEKIISKINIIGVADCSKAIPSSAGNSFEPNFVTADGMRWLVGNWKYSQEWPNSSNTFPYIDIYVDVNGNDGMNKFTTSSENLECEKLDVYKIRLGINGKVYTPGGSKFACENEALSTPTEVAGR